MLRPQLDPVSVPPASMASGCLEYSHRAGVASITDCYDKAPFKFKGTIENVYVKYKAIAKDCVEDRIAKEVAV